LRWDFVAFRMELFEWRSKHGMEKMVLTDCYLFDYKCLFRYLIYTIYRYFWKVTFRDHLPGRTAKSLLWAHSLVQSSVKTGFVLTYKNTLVSPERLAITYSIVLFIAESHWTNCWCHGKCKSRKKQNQLKLEIWLQIFSCTQPSLASKQILHTVCM
jgi:hypothetical protein